MGLAQEEIDNKQVNTTKRRYLIGCDHCYQGNKQGDVMGSYLKVTKVFSEDVI